MGTHAALAVTYDDKSHCCVERTLDGHFLQDNTKDILLRVLKGEVIVPQDEADLIGNGSIEIDNNREHDQEYFLHIDYAKKEIYLLYFPTIEDDEFDVTLLKELYSHGWKVKGRDECCPLTS